ncbi:MAG: hypothetical protein COA58_04165 [Bacteroidetes bacterium]|nr:MAG: hypothetical protein COA58_04165 [Bacteroidota bacterium]
MRKFLALIFFIAAQGVFAQSTTLLIARNIGKKVLDDGTEIRTFGYATKLSENPGIPGPTLIYEEGDSVKIDMWNVSQGAPHTIHLHGLDVDQQNDGVPHLSFEVEHMEHGYYRFKAPHPGTYLYHCHVVSAIHVQAGMYGMLIIKPKGNDKLTWEGGYSFSRDYNFLLSEIDTNWHTDAHLLHPIGHVKIKVPPYDPTYFLVNGSSGTQLRSEAKKVFLKNDNTFLRLANIGYYANRYIFSDKLNASVVSSDGRPLPEAMVSDTLMVFPGERYGVLVNPDNLGDDSVKIEYLNLNTLSVKGTEYMHYEVVEELSANTVSPESFKVFPNPFTSSLRLTNLSKESIKNIAISTTSGQSVYSRVIESNSSIVLQVEHLGPGSYILKATTESGNEIRRLLHKF